MYLAKVIGTVVATKKDERLRGHKLLLVEYVTMDDCAAYRTSPPIVAVDIVGAGLSELVLVVTGQGARNALSDSTTPPVDATIVGIVDQVSG